MGYVVTESAGVRSWGCSLHFGPITLRYLTEALASTGFLIHGDGSCLMLIVRVKQENYM